MVQGQRERMDVQDSEEGRNTGVRVSINWSEQQCLGSQEGSFQRRGLKS